MAKNNSTSKGNAAAAKNKGAAPTPTTKNPRSLISVLVFLNRGHPSGHFRRAGKTFTIDPTVFQLTAEEIKDLKTIPQIVNLRFDESAISRFSKTKPNKGKAVDVKEAAAAADAKAAEDEENDIPADYKDATQAEIIAKLEEKGLVAGKDFEPESSKKSLIDILLA